VEAPRIEACWFGEGPQGEMYRRLAEVLEFTARRFCGGWRVNVEHLQPKVYRSVLGQPSHEWNTQKFEFWVRQVLAAPDGDRIALLDGDTMIVSGLDSIWDHDFDLAYTYRENDRLPLNAGVIFVRVSARTREFMRLWWAWNLHFLNPKDYPDVDGRREPHDRWRLRYAGINQASLGYMLERVQHGCHVLKVPCSVWNCVNWTHYTERTRIVHIKSALRRAVFNLKPAASTPPTKAIMRLWYDYEAEAKAACARA